MVGDRKAKAVFVPKPGYFARIYAESVRPVMEGMMKRATEKVVADLTAKIKKTVRLHYRCIVTRKDFNNDCERQFEELQHRAYYPEVPGYDPYNHVGKKIMIAVAWWQTDEAMEKAEQAMGTMKGAAEKTTKSFIDWSKAVATEWKPISEFDKDLAGAMVTGLYGYDPRSHVGCHVVSNVLGP